MAGDAVALLEAKVTDLQQKVRDLELDHAHAGQKCDSDPVHSLPGISLSVVGAVSGLHNLLLLADSALPLGSFAFSSGLESYLAHERPPASHSAHAFNHFLRMSLDSMTDTTLPYVVRAFQEPSQLEDLDNDLDASITCSVARRASVSQGRALIAVWERSFRAQLQDTLPSSARPIASDSAYKAVEAFCKSIKLMALAKSQHHPGLDTLLAPNGHLPPFFGALGATLRLPLDHVLYTYLLNHAKTLLSAGIRASTLGPYQAQGVLASGWLQEHISLLVNREIELRRDPGEAGQCTPLLDLWGGRHDIIYSRIFNS